MKIKLKTRRVFTSGEAGTAARQYAERGVRVVPCRPSGPNAKAPLLANGVHGASSAPHCVSDWWKRWPDALIGVAIPPGIVVFDIDPRNGGSRESLELVVGALPETLSVASGANDGGEHLYYRMEPQLLGRKLPGAVGVDVLTSGYVIAPPSLHPATGLPYRPNMSYDLEAAAGLPEAALDRIRAVQQGERRPLEFRASSRATAWPPMRTMRLVEVVGNAVKGDRNKTLYWAARRVAEDCPAEFQEAVVDALLSAAIDSGLGAHEAEATIQSALSRAARGGVA